MPHRLRSGGLAAPLSLKGSYPWYWGTCGTTISVGTCTVVIQYTPTVAGKPDTVELGYNDGANTQTATRRSQELALLSQSLLSQTGQPMTMVLVF